MGHSTLCHSVREPHGQNIVCRHTCGICYFWLGNNSQHSPQSYITPEGAAQMMAAMGVKAQWHTAQKICVENGYALKTKQFKNCFIEYQLHSLRAANPRQSPDRRRRPETRPVHRPRTV